MKKIGSCLWKLIEKIVVGCLRLLYTALHKELTEDAIDGFMQFVKFGLVGVSNTVVNYVIYAGALLFLQKNHLWKAYDYLIATGIGFVLSVLWSFFWNNKFVFTVGEGENRFVLKALLKTYVSYSFTGLFLNSFLMVLWVKMLGISEFVAPIINLLVSVPLNFLINKFWAFKSER